MKYFKGILQYNSEDCGAACLTSIIKYHGIKVNLNDIRRKLAFGKEGANMLGISDIANTYGLVTDTYQGDIDDLTACILTQEIEFPFIVHVELSNHSGHFLIVKKIKGNMISIFDPAEGNRKIDLDKFISIWTGYVMTFRKNEDGNIDNTTSKSFDIYLKRILEEKKSF